MRGHLYNNFIALAFSYCPQHNCYDDKKCEHYSAFMIFSYPNGTDKELNIKDYLFKNNKYKINNIIIDLKENVKIENNIFGYIYYGYIIKENECNNIYLLSYNTNNTISIDETIEDEKIRLQFKDSIIYNISNCIIRYPYIFNEPNYDNYKNYIDIINNTYGEFDENSYNSQKEKYEGKTIYYKINIENELSTECVRNCELCLKENNSCITCK